VHSERKVSIVDFKTLLKNKNKSDKKYILLDGAMGTMLQASGLKLGQIPEVLSFTNEELLIDIHRQYVNSGSDIIYTNTFGGNRYKLDGCGYTVEQIVKKGIENARKACEGTDCMVALDIGPIGKLVEPTGDLKFEEAYDIYKEQIAAGRDADLVVFETMTDLLELKAAVLAAKENSELPIICTMTFEQNMRTFTGCQVSTMEGLGVDALGVNCSLGPDELYPVVEELAKYTRLPLVVKPNAGLPDPVTNEYNVGPEEFAVKMSKMASIGATIMGGCCGTSPEYIAELKKALDCADFVRKETEYVSAVCSASNTVVINQPRIIGERINPTGKKLFKQALKEHNLDYIMNQALEQIDGGAEILDVNVGLPEIDEKEMMVDAIRAIQSVCDVPLQIDSTIPEVLEAGLRIYCGKPIVNSVNGEENSLNNVLPLVKKYGACVVGLTLDENGIPKTATERVAIAGKILDRALEIGIPKENVFIDCLTLTASAEQDGVMETLNALHTVRYELGLNTVLGVSNISFGLPYRELVNQNFLSMALTYGLTLPIINPNVVSMTGAVRAYRLLTGVDRNSMDYIQAYNGYTPAKSVKAEKSPEAQSGTANADAPEKGTLAYAVENGLKNEGARLTAEMLEHMEALDITLIPALDRIGKNFEKGKVFLPQLILAAEVTQSSFEVIKKKLAADNKTPVSKGKIVMATVKGDVHDIGKNIVKVILENYGYTVIDLGKDVDYMAVVNAAIEHKAKLVGLSALMTTTLVSMEKTIQLLREYKVDCKVVVGGAVLTPEYAKQIGADYYAKDAMDTVAAAREVLG
jgi:5-methyltetrahydrofolate--homocysteine methyltransferase